MILYTFFIYDILYRLVISAFVLFIFLLNYYNEIVNISVINEKPEVYDFIIVGGGSAGSVVAKRLSEDPKIRVLLIEAGSRVPGFLNIPAIGTLYQGTAFDWKYKTVPQKHSCFGLDNQSSKWPAGKVLGGTSHLNYMLYMRGHKNDFQSFQDTESGEWSYEDILYYFNKSEKYLNCSKSCGTSDTSSGSLNIRDTVYSTKLSDVVLSGAEELGYRHNDINNNGDGTGFMKPSVNIMCDGSRWSSDRNLKQNNNLKIITNKIVNRILFKYNYEAYGVETNDKLYVAKHEIIITAGTVGSPKLLLLSGIGPLDHLRKHKIDTIADLPVGHNLLDHVTTGLDLIKLKEGVFGVTSLLSPLAAWRYLTSGSGTWTSTMCETVGVVKTAGAGDTDVPDLQLMVMIGGLSSDRGIFMKKCMGVSDEMWYEYYDQMKDQSVATILPVVLHPLSTGYVELASSDPAHSPVINPNYLSHPQDVSTLIRGVRLIQNLTMTDSMVKFGVEFNNVKFSKCVSAQVKYDSDLYWECYVRHVTLTAYHPVGTCKMGHSGRRDTVVDHRLRVSKLNKLRVIDGSVLPNLPSGNPNAVIVMIAEKGADMIKYDLYTSRGVCSRSHVFLPQDTCQIFSRY